jgi:DNA-3-methyladenine glycosylase
MVLLRNPKGGAVKSEKNVILTKEFFNHDAQHLAKALLGKVLYAWDRDMWLSAMIIETEAYYLEEKASHSSLGFTVKRRALFMEPGTIYMYYARGSDSLNISAQGEGNAVLIKSAYPYIEKQSDPSMIARMQANNPQKNSTTPRPIYKLCSGQTLLCRSLNLKVPQWDAQQFNPNSFFIADKHYEPLDIITTPRLGIPSGRDEHLPYRFILHEFARYATRNGRDPRRRVSPEHEWP